MAKLEKQQMDSGVPLHCHFSVRLHWHLLLILITQVVCLFALFYLPKEPSHEKAAASSTFNEKQVRREEVAGGKDRSKDDLSASLMKQKSLRLLNTDSEKRNRISLSSDCGVPDFTPKPHSRIVGGVEARPHSWPWQASVMILSQNAWHHWCGGIVLSPTWIITAAHCLHGHEPASNFRVRLGAHDKVQQGEMEQVFDVEEIIMHSKYHNVTNDNDIALLRLLMRAQFNSYIKPICLPEVDVGENFLCVISGWGSTQGTTVGNKNALQQVYVPVIGHSECNQLGWYNGRITDNMLCAGYPEGLKDACQGDSGGPLACLYENRWRLFGVTSFGDGCALAYRPGVYTRVTKYLEWITEKQKDSTVT